MLTPVCINQGPNWCNVYIYGEHGKPCLVFDFGGNDPADLIKHCLKHHSSIAGIFLTHGHYDHVSCVSDLDDNVQVFMSEDDLCCLDDPALNFSKSLVGEPKTIELSKQPYFVEDGDEISLAGHVVRCVATPYHTVGGMCYLVDEKYLFSGDSLFKLGVGRTDLRHNDKTSMRPSLIKLASLDDEIDVFPGHGAKTTIGAEKAYNPYLKIIF